jgi:hypothetical protein
MWVSQLFPAGAFSSAAVKAGAGVIARLRPEPPQTS